MLGDSTGDNFFLQKIESNHKSIANTSSIPKLYLVRLSVEEAGGIATALVGILILHMGLASTFEAHMAHVKVDEPFLKELIQFWNLGYCCFSFNKEDMMPTVEEYATLFNLREVKKLRFMLSPLKQNNGKRSKGVSGLTSSRTFVMRRLCGEYPGVWGGIGCAPLLVSRKYGSRQFVPIIVGLNTSEFEFLNESINKSENEALKKQVEALGEMVQECKIKITFLEDANEEGNDYWFTRLRNNAMKFQKQDEWNKMIVSQVQGVAQHVVMLAKEAVALRPYIRLLRDLGPRLM
ncbi:hypothetical protein GQ457_15G021120 [Hibiscus cannabinus]